MDHGDQFEEKVDHNKDFGLEEAAHKPEVDRFTEFMFGPRASSGKQEHNHQHQPANKGDSQTDEVTYFTLVEQIDDIMTSLKNLKPMIEELSPIIDYIKKKI